MTPTFKNLVFKGGGVKGIAYAGAIKELEDEGVLDGIEQVAGTSAGAITAALLAFRFSASEFKDVIWNTNFKSFEDGLNPLRIITKYGLYKGDAFLKWFKKHLSDKGIDEEITFEQMHNSGKFRGLRVFGTDLTTQDSQEFSYRKTPKTIVAEAVRASMSIPLFFNAWQFSNSQPNDHLYVDGGMVFNYPISTYDSGNTVNPETLGLHLDNLSGAPTQVDLDYDEIIKYVRDVFVTILKAQNINFERNPEELARTIRIDDFGISPTDFGLSDANKTKLFNSGVKYTKEWLANRRTTA